MTFSVIKVDDLCLDVVNRWKQQYPIHTLLRDGQTSGDILKQLEALGSQPKKEDIDRIVGNQSWTSIGCSYCKNQEQQALVILECRDEPASYICKNCLQEALNGL